MLVFLKANRVEQLPYPDELEQKTLDTAAGLISKDKLIKWLRSYIHSK